MKNPEWKWVYVSLAAAVVFTVLVFTAESLVDCMHGGCAIMFVSIFLAISSFAVSVLFLTRARMMDSILSGEVQLAHWVYPDEETRKSAEREYISYRETNRGLFLVVAFFMVIAIVFMAVFMGEGGMITALVLLAVLAIIAVVSEVAPRLELKRALKAPGEAFISDTGVVYEGAVYPFSSFMMSKTGVTFVEKNPKHPALLVFSFFQLVGVFIPRSFTISIPVPPGEEENARRIADRLG